VSTTRTTPARGLNGGSRGYGGFFSSARTFQLPVGSNVSADELGGYYIDFSRKVSEPSWPPPWFRPTQRHVVSAQWGLGCFERYLNGEGDKWLMAAVDVAGHLTAIQERDGVHEGGWPHQTPMPHTYRLDVPWLSGMAQGEGASLLARVHLVTGDERFADAARRALHPLAVSVRAGGVQGNFEDGGSFPQEYPTDPPSFVLNGGIFALWGYHDVALALGVAEARQEFERGVDSLARNIHRWDTGQWSRYDLYPHPVTNIASSSYHVLHINQLHAMQMIAPRKEFEATVARFESYLRDRSDRMRAFARKSLFRLVVPRNRMLAWIGRRDRATGRDRR